MRGQLEMKPVTTIGRMVRMFAQTNHFVQSTRAMMAMLS